MHGVGEGSVGSGVARIERADVVPLNDGVNAEVNAGVNAGVNTGVNSEAKRCGGGMA